MRVIVPSLGVFGHTVCRGRLVRQRHVVFVLVVLIGIGRLRKRGLVLDVGLCDPAFDDGQPARCRRRAHVNGGIGFGLYDLDQPFLHELENRDERDRDAHAAFFGTEELREIDERGVAQTAQDVGHALAHGEALASDAMAREHLGTLQHVLEGHEHFLQRDLRNHLHDFPLDELCRRRQRIALEAGEIVEVLGSFLESLVLLQAPHELGARILFFLPVRRHNPRQQHAGLDLRQHRRHQQILARELELQLGHHVDVLHVLTRDLRDRNIEDIQVLLANEIEQQI